MSVMMKEIGSTDGDACRCSFDRCKGRVIIHYVIRKEDLLPSAAAHIQSGEVIQRASCANARKEPAVLSIPEAMWLQSVFLLWLVNSGGLFGCGRQRPLLLPGFLRAGAGPRSKNNKKEEAEQIDFLRVRHFQCCRLLPPGFRIIAVVGTNPIAKMLAWLCCPIGNGISPGVVILFLWSYLQI